MEEAASSHGDVTLEGKPSWSLSTTWRLIKRAAMNPHLEDEQIAARQDARRRQVIRIRAGYLGIR